MELQGHGGVVLRRVLRCIEAGAVMAEPSCAERSSMGVWLTQAEGLSDLPARSDRAAKAALEQLDGALSHAFNSFTTFFK